MFKLIRNLGGESEDDSEDADPSENNDEEEKDVPAEVDHSSTSRVQRTEPEDESNDS